MNGEWTLKVLAFWVVVQVLGNLVTEFLKHPDTRRIIWVMFVSYRQETFWTRLINDFSLIVLTITTALVWIVVIAYGLLLYHRLQILTFAVLLLALLAGFLCWSVASAEKSWTNGTRYFWAAVVGALLYASAEAFESLNNLLAHLGHH